MGSFRLLEVSYSDKDDPIIRANFSTLANIKIKYKVDNEVKELVHEFDLAGCDFSKVPVGVEVYEYTTSNTLKMVLRELLDSVGSKTFQLIDAGVEVV